MAKQRLKQEVCPNCGYTMGKEANYCPQCGQENHVKIQSLKNILGDWMEAIFSFDTRLLRTLQVIASAPGKITLLFQAGKHVSYVSPLRLYLFSSVLMFFMLNVYIKHHELGEFDRAAILADTSNVQIQVGFDSEELSMTPKEFASLAKAPDAVLDSVLRVNGDTTPSFFERIFIRQIAKIIVEGQAQYLVEVVRNTSVSMFVLMPLFAVFLWLFYKKKVPFYVTHLVFSLHYHAVFFLFFAMGFALDIWLDLSDLSYIFFASLIYQVLALKRTYEYPFFATIFRFLGINFLYFFAISFVVLGVSIVSLLTF